MRRIFKRQASYAWPQTVTVDRVLRLPTYKGAARTKTSWTLRSFAPSESSATLQEFAGWRSCRRATCCTPSP
jgi:hypothetical protein